MVSGSRVTWAASVPILDFLGFSVLDLGPVYSTDRQKDVRQHHRLMPPPKGAGHNKARPVSETEMAAQSYKSKSTPEGCQTATSTAGVYSERIS